MMPMPMHDPAALIVPHALCLIYGSGTVIRINAERVANIVAVWKPGLESVAAREFRNYLESITDEIRNRARSNNNDADAGLVAVEVRNATAADEMRMLNEPRFLVARKVMPDEPGIVRRAFDFAERSVPGIIASMANGNPHMIRAMSDLDEWPAPGTSRSDVAAELTLRAHRIHADRQFKQQKA